MLDISIVIVNWNTRDLLAQCLASVEQTTAGLKIETLVVDNASTDGSREMLRERFPGVRLIVNQENLGFARANNQGVAISQGRYVLLLNSDAQLLPNALQAMLAVAEAKPRVALVGAQLLNRDGSFQASHTPLPNLWQEFLILSGIGRTLYGRWYPSRGPEEAKGPQMAGYVEGACMLIRREAYQEVGGLDEGYFMYAEEVALCCALREKNWQVWYQPAAKVIHLGGGSSLNRRPEREGDLYRSRVRFFRKHYGNRPAQLLKLQILCLTVTKIMIHGLLRRISGGCYGRPVVSLRDLMAKLRGV